MRTALLIAALVSARGFATEPVDPDPTPATVPTPEVSAAAPIAEAPPARLPSLEIALKGGAHLPQVINKLGTSFDATLMIGYAPFESRQLQFFVDVGYSQPSQTVKGTDPRLGDAGADYTSTLTMRDLAMSLGLSYFFRSPARTLVPYAGAGVRAHFLKAEVSGAGGAEFGQNNETDTRFGGVVFAGLGIHLGPGLLLGEVSFNYAPIDQKVTGNTNVGALSLLLGYGLLL